MVGAQVGSGTETRVNAISYVLQSLTAKHRDILMLLAEKQLASSGAGGADAEAMGLAGTEFRTLCQKSEFCW